MPVTKYIYITCALAEVTLLSEQLILGSNMCLPIYYLLLVEWRGSRNTEMPKDICIYIHGHNKTRGKERSCTHEKKPYLVGPDKLSDPWTVLFRAY